MTNLFILYIFTQDLTLLLFRGQRTKFTSAKYQTSFNGSFNFLPLWKQQRMISNTAVKQIKVRSDSGKFFTKRIRKSNLQLSDFVSTYLLWGIVPLNGVNQALSPLDLQ